MLNFGKNRIKLESTRTSTFKTLPYKPSIQTQRGLPHLVQVAVAPHLPVHEGAGEDAPLGVVLRPLAHAASLESHQLAGGGVGDVDHRQAAAGLPDGRPALGVVGDAQGELAVVVVDLLRACVPVKVNGEQVAAMSLCSERKTEKKEREGEREREGGREGGRDR